MAEQPRLLRTVRVADMPDADWAATQVAPDVSICADVRTCALFGAVFIAYDANGAIVNPSGNIDVALIDVASTSPPKGLAAKTIVKTMAVDSAVVAGAGLKYDVSGSRSVTLRVTAQNLASDVSYIEIWWTNMLAG